MKLTVYYGWAESIFVFYLKSKNKKIGLLPLYFLIAILGRPASAQIVPDATLSTPSTVRLEGDTNVIEGGTRNGDNLFHSFQEFSVPTGGSAFFNNDLDVRNIFSRVTGGSISNIDGLIRANGTANLFLLNPNGIIFGPNARLNIGGSFLASTANSIQFADGTLFSATVPQTTPLLTISVPVGLQYGGTAPAIVVQGAGADTDLGSIQSFNDSMGLQVQPGQTLALVGGEVTLDGGILQARGGRVELGGVAGAGTVGLNIDPETFQVTSLQFPDGLARSPISLTHKAAINVIGGGLDLPIEQQNGGGIAIHAGDLTLQESLLASGIGLGGGSPDARSGDINLDATGAIALFSSGVINQVNPNATGNGGNLLVKAGSLTLTQSGFSTGSLGAGNGGNISVQTDGAVSIVASRLLSLVGLPGQSDVVGNAGNIKIQAASLTLTDGGKFITRTDGMGNAGNVDINVSGAVEIAGVPNNDNPSVFDPLPSGIFSNVQFGAEGNGGNINIQAGSLSVLDGAQVNASTFGTGNAGNIAIAVRDGVTVAGANDFPSISQIASQVGNIDTNDSPQFANGNGGDVTLSANTLTIRDGARLSTLVLVGEGKAGNINIDVKGNVTLAGQTNLLNLGGSAVSSLVGAAGKGKGGDVTLQAGALSLSDGAEISASTRGEGDAGNINLSVGDRIALIGPDSTNSQTPFNIAPRIISEVGVSGSGRGGDINIEARSLDLTNGSRISTRTLNNGEAGDISIHATDSIHIFGTQPINPVALLIPFRGASSGVYASSDSLFNIATGGDINLTTGTLRVDDGGVVSVRTSGSANGGNITVNADTLKLTNGGQLLSTTLGSGDAGNITVNANRSITLSGRDRTFSDRFEQLKNQNNEGRVAELFDSFIGLNEKSGIFANAASESGGQARDVTLTTRRLTVRDEAEVAVGSAGSGAAGTLTVKARDLRLDNGTLTADTFAGKGNIQLQAQSIQLRRNSRIRTDAGNADGGNITIDTDTLAALENSDITANAQIVSLGGQVLPGNPEVRGGRVVINAQGIFGTEFRQQLTPKSDITATSSLGAQFSGTVELNTPDVDPSSGLVELPTDVVDATRLVVQQCKADGETSKLSVTGRGGLPPNPSDTLGSSAVWQDFRLPAGGEQRSRGAEEQRSRGETPSLTTKIVEAQGWAINTQGEVTLTAAVPTATPQRPGLPTTECRQP